MRTELGALRRPQVVLTLLVGVVGFGGMFATYSYIAPLATDVAGLSRGMIPAVLLVYGVGGVVGTALGGRLADLALFRSLVGAEIAVGLVLASVLALSPHPVGLFVDVFLLAMTASVLVVCLQLRLMSVAGDAQMLGAALNHSALNMANALGAWLGGAVIAAGLGYRAPSAVGAVLAAGGLAFLAASAVLRRRTLVPEAASAGAAATTTRWQPRSPDYPAAIAWYRFHVVVPSGYDPPDRRVPPASSGSTEGLIHARTREPSTGRRAGGENPPSGLARRRGTGDSVAGRAAADGCRRRHATGPAARRSGSRTERPRLRPEHAQAQIQATVDAVAAQQVDNQFGNQRYALLFKPGTYGSAADPLVFQVGYYTEVAGLGQTPST